MPFTENKGHVEPEGLWAEFIQESRAVEAAVLQSRAQGLQASKLEARVAGASAEAQGPLGLWASSPWGLTGSGEVGQGVAPSPAVDAPGVWATVKVETEQQLVPVPRGLQVKVKLEPGTGLAPRDEGLSNRKSMLSRNGFYGSAKLQSNEHSSMHSSMGEVAQRETRGAVPCSELAQPTPQACYEAQ